VWCNVHGQVKYLRVIGFTPVHPRLQRKDDLVPLKYGFHVPRIFLGEPECAIQILSCEIIEEE
jgi:hypothetical protein